MHPPGTAARPQSSRGCKPRKKQLKGEVGISQINRAGNGRVLTPARPAPAVSPPANLWRCALQHSPAPLALSRRLYNVLTAPLAPNPQPRGNPTASPKDAQGRSPSSGSRLIHQRGSPRHRVGLPAASVGCRDPGEGGISYKNGLPNPVSPARPAARV